MRAKRPLMRPPHATPSQPASASQPQVGSTGSTGSSHPQLGSSSAPQTGSQLSSQPCFAIMRAKMPLIRPPHAAPSQVSTTSAPQTGSTGSSHPQVGSASAPQTGSHASQASVLQNPNRPNALALAELEATIAIANRAGTITRRIVNSPWKKVSGRLLQRLSRNTSERPKTSFQALARHRSLTIQIPHCRSIGVWRRQRRTPIRQGVHAQLSTTRACRMRSFAKIYRLTFLSGLNLSSIFVSPIIRIMTCGLIPPRKLRQKLYWIHKENDRVHPEFPDVNGIRTLVITPCENGIPRRRW